MWEEVREIPRYRLQKAVNLCPWMDFKQGGEEAGFSMIKLDV